jgi:hypothetical protein
MIKLPKVWMGPRCWNIPSDNHIPNFEWRRRRFPFWRRMMVGGPGWWKRKG